MILHLCVVVLLVAWLGTTNGLEDEGCGRPADIAFILDSSRSIAPSNFQIQKEFVKKLVNQFDIHADNTRVAALQFAEKATVDFYFNPDSTKEGILDKIGAINQSLGGMTNTHLALKLMMTDLFNPANGARKGVSKICILLSDGASTYKRYTAQEAENVKKEGIILLAVGVGRVNIKEMQSLVTPPSEDNFFYIRGFREMEKVDFISLVGQQACAVTDVIPVTDAPITFPPTEPTTPKPTTTKPTTPKPTTPKPTTPKPTKPKPPMTTPGMISDKAKDTCQGKSADVLFILDMSSSIWFYDFQDQLAFVNDIISNFDIDSGKTKVGVMAFSDNVSVEFDFNQFNNRDDIYLAVKNIITEGGVTMTHKALDLAADEMFTPVAGARPGVAHICVLITDGRSSEPQLTLEAAQKLHNNGIYLFAIGVGNMTDKTELEQIATKPIKEFMYEVNGYQALHSIRDILSFKTCEVPQGDQPKCAKDISGDVLFGLFNIGGSYRTEIATFMESIVGGLDLASGNVRAGVLESCGTAQSPLTAYTSKAEFKNELDEDMTTGIYNLIKSARNVMRKGRARDNTNFVIVFVTGDIPDIDDVMSHIHKLHYRARVFVVGVGENINEKQLMKLAYQRDPDEPDMSHVFAIKDPKNLQFSVLKLHLLMCQAL